MKLIDTFRTLSLAGLVFASLGAAPTGQVQTLELRGRVVCLPEVIHTNYETELPVDHAHILGLQAADGSLYTILRAKYSEALFVDQRVRSKELLLKGRLFPKSHFFEVERIRSFKAGIVQDLYYYCSVCSIETVSPGPCACCQGPVELMEKPWSERHR